MTQLAITITGVSPLICNRFTEDAARKATLQTSSALTSAKGTPREKAEPKLYLDDKKRPCVPGPNIYRAIIDAGKFHKAGKTKVTTQKSSLICAAATMLTTDAPIKFKGPWDVDERPVRNPATGGRFLCWRPRFNEWSLSFEMSLDEDMISENVLRQIVDDAGSKIGLGDFRPDRKGPFGRFVVTSWKVTQK